MATDSTNLPLGETNLDAGTDMAGNELDLAGVQLAQVEGAQPIQLPQGQKVILIPVQPGQVIQLPTDSINGLLAKIGPEGNLAFVIDGRTIILQGYVKANDEKPVKIVTNDGDPVVPAEIIANTDKTLDIQTAAGPATGAQGDTDVTGSGIFTPFIAGPGPGLIDAVGVLGATALQYRLIDDEQKEFTRDEGDPSPDFTITFDILGGIVNEDDLPADQIEFPQDQFRLAKFVLGDDGTSGKGNDEFDPTDREEGGLDSDGDDGYPDPDREPLVTVATINVDFHGDTPGKLELDLSLLPTGLKSEGEDIVYQLFPADPGVHGNGILAFVDNGGVPGEFDDGIDRLVFSAEVDKDESNGEFKVTFTLYDNIDNEAPDSLIGKEEQILDLPVKFTITDSTGSTAVGTLPLGVEDDIPFFGQVDDCGVEPKIVQTDADITHDESLFVQGDADDEISADVILTGLGLAIKLNDAGFSLPTLGESIGTTLGAAQTKIHVSFGADGPTEFIGGDIADTSVRNSVFGALLDKADGTVDDVGDGAAAENEHPFELFMVQNTHGDPISDADLTITDQATQNTVTWNGELKTVFLHQIDAHTIVGYINVGGDAPDEAKAEFDIDSDQEAVFVIHIEDDGTLTFIQFHQLNHANPDPNPNLHDEDLTILGEDGTPLIYVRATDFDGDHAIQPVNLVIQDDGPRFLHVIGTHGVDEDVLPGGNLIPPGPGDNNPFDGKTAFGVVAFSIGEDRPGDITIQDLTVTDHSGNPVDLANLKTADDQPVVIDKSNPESWVGHAGSLVGPIVFVFELNTTGEAIGLASYKFTLHQPLEHSLEDNPSTKAVETSFEDDLHFDFTVRATDIDGDWADGSVEITIDDDSPVALKNIFESFRLTVDETIRETVDKDGKFIDINAAGGPPTDDGTTKENDEIINKAAVEAAGLSSIGLIGAGTENTSDLFLASPGADGGTIEYTLNFVAGPSGLTDTLTTEGINLVLGAGGVIEGRTETTNQLVFALTIDSDTGLVTMAQYRAVNHGVDAAPGFPDEVKSLGEDKISVTVTVIDNDGDKATQTRDIGDGIRFEDDGPKTDLILNGGVTITVDESVGPSTPSDTNLNDPDELASGDAKAIGFATVAGNTLFSDITDFGTDGPAIDPSDKVYAFTLTAGVSGLTDTVSGLAVALTLVGGEILGKAGADLVFKISIDPTDGDTTVTQYRAVKHGDTSDPDESDTPEFIDAGRVFVQLTVKDGDTDTASDKVDIGGIVRFEDDGPTVDIALKDQVELRLDESLAPSKADDPNGNDGDELASGDKTDIGYATIKGSALFTASIDFGSDKGAKIDSTIYELTVPEDGNDSGLVDTGTGLAVLLYDVGAQIVGKTSGGDKVFTIDVNAGTGDVTVHQFRAVVHDDPTDSDESDGSILPETIDAGLIGLKVTVTDGDGDKASDSIDLGPVIVFEDDGPLFIATDFDQEDGDFSAGIGIIDEDELATGNKDSAPGDDGGKTQTDGFIKFDFGTDQPGTLLIDGLTITDSAGKTIDLADLRTADGVEIVIEKSIDLVTEVVTWKGVEKDGPDAGDTVFTFTLDTFGTGIGKFEFTLDQALEHPYFDADFLHNGPDTTYEDNLLFDFTVVAKDGDNDTATGHIKIDIDDDSPKITLVDESLFLHVDETVGGTGVDVDANGAFPLDGTAVENDEDDATLSLKALGDVIGFDSGKAGALFSYSAGADGEESVTYGLKVLNGGVTSLIDTQTGESVVLSLNAISGMVEGRTAGTDELVLVFEIDTTSGTVAMAQYRAVDHGTDQPASYPDEVAFLNVSNQSILAVTLEVIDADGDKATAERDISFNVQFDDDGPHADLLTITIGGGSDSLLVHDETAGVQNNGNGTGAPDPDPSGQDEDDVLVRPAAFDAFELLPANLGIQPVGYASTTVAILDGVTPLTDAVYGSDGPGTTKIELTDGAGNPFNGDQSNLIDTPNGRSIFLYSEGGLVVGRVGGVGNVPDPFGQIAFAISIDGDSLDVAQYWPIKHPDPSEHDESVTLLNGPATQGSALVFATVTITDKDGDSITKSIPFDGVEANPAIIFQDDGPTANADTDSVKDGGPTVATGNVLNGDDGGFEPLKESDANGEDGVDDTFGTDGFGGISWEDSADDGEKAGIDEDGKIQGTFGTLYVDEEGNYRYELDVNDQDTKDLSKGEIAYETFTYTIKDGDDDTDSTTLTIKVEGDNEDPDIDLDPEDPNTDDEKAVVSDEGLTGGNKDDTPAGDETNFAVFTSTLVVSDPDGDVLTVKIDLPTPADIATLPAWTFSDGKLVSWLLSGDGQTLTGTANGSPAITVELGALVANSAPYTVTLHQPLDHPIPNLEDELSFSIPIKVTDPSGGFDTATLTVEVEDDSPVVSLTTSSPFALAVDETVGGGADVAPNPGTTAENDETLFVMPAGLIALGTTIGEAQASAVGLFTSSAGADGQASKVYTLSITGGGATGLTDTATSTAITLVPGAGGVVEGRANAGAGPVVFAFSVDATTGQVSMAQYRAINHGNEEIAPGNHDEAKFMSAGVLAVTLTVTDKDGDSDSKSKDISGSISIDDDGPLSAAISFVNGKNTLDDEGSPLATFAGIEGAETGVDVAGAPNSVTFDVSVNAGSDGLGSIAYNLAQIQSQNAGLKAIDKTADGATITFSIDGGGDIIGKIDDAGAGKLDGTTVLRVHATDADTFQVTELSPLFHTGQGEDPDLDFKVVLDVTDKDGDSIQTTATVKIDDDMPNALPESGKAESEAVMNTNLLLILDDSGSMVGDQGATDLTGINKLQALQASVNELFEQYGNLGEVRVCFVRFDTTASTLTSDGKAPDNATENVWLTLAQAKSLLATLVGGGSTNYDDAMEEAIASYQISGKLEPADVTGPIQNVGYYISDGEPNANQQWGDPYNVGASWTPPPTGAGISAADLNGKLDQEEEYIQHFLKGEDIKMFSIGIGDGINATAADHLERISYDGKAEVDDDANLYIELKDLSQLTQSLVGTVVVPVGGVLGDFGADGGYVKQVTFPGGFQANYNGTTISVVNAGGVTGTVNPGGSPIPGGTNVVKVLLATGSALFINMLTGAWQYVPVAGDSATYLFGFTLTDYDGDTDSNVLTVSNTLAGLPPIARDDTVISNVDGKGATIIVPTAAFLWNDDDKGSPPLTFNATLTNISDLDPATAVAAGNVTIKDNNDEDGGSFTYKAETSAGSDTANVVVNRSQDGEDTLEGNGLDNILVGTDSGEEINAYEGNDVLLGYGGKDTLNGGDGRDWLIGGADNDTLDGGADNDLLDGGSGNDSQDGESGDDILIFDAADSVMNGGSGNDILDVSAAGNIDFTLFDDGRISNMETIRMTGGGNSAITLNSQDVIDHFEGGSFDPDGAGFDSKSVLRVEGNVGDTVNLVSGGTDNWVIAASPGGNIPAGFTLYVHVTSGIVSNVNEDAYVLVQSGLTVNAS